MTIIKSYFLLQNQEYTTISVFGTSNILMDFVAEETKETNANL